VECVKSGERERKRERERERERERARARAMGSGPEEWNLVTVVACVARAEPECALHRGHRLFAKLNLGTPV